jgi:hypothetical protein
VVAYIDVESLRKVQASPLAALLGLTGSKTPEDREYLQFVRETGFDYARDLDLAAIAFWPDSLGAAPQDKSADNRVFAVADGRFDERKIRAYALKSGTAHPTGIQTIYEVPGTPSTSFEFLSPTRIAIASGTKSRDLLTSSYSPGRDSALQTRIDRVAGAPLFAVARTDRLPNSVYASFRNSPQIESLARSVVGLTLAAQPQGDRLQVVLDGETTSSKNALAITTFLEISRMGFSIASSNSKAFGQLAEERAGFLDALIRQSRISRQDRWVRLDFDITPQMLSGSPAGQTSAARPKE